MSDAEKQLLERLEESVLFSGELPKRRVTSHAESVGLSEDERRAAVQVGISAIEMVKNFQQLAGMVRKLGTEKYEPAVPALARLWRECAVQPVRTAAGHALRSIGSASARAALKDLLVDADRMSVFMAVRAMFDEDPPSAFERFSRYFDEGVLERPGGSIVAHEALATFSPSLLKGGNEPSWFEPRAPEWLRDDPRWIQLCVRFRKHQALGRVARDVLRYADKSAVAAALEAARSTEERREVCVVSRPRGDLVSRYRKGEHDAVWKTLREYDAISGALREEAIAVAQETMKRVLHNSDLLIARLKEKGWVPLFGAFHTPPSQEDTRVMLEIERRTSGPIPPSLKAFWDVVGGIDLVWNYDKEEDPPDFGLDVELFKLDPVSVLPARSVTYLFEEWDDAHEGIDPELADPFNLDLAPDYLHKANISGGPPYGVELPFLGPDPVFQNEAHELPFVDYLRLAFRSGGFSRLDRHLNDSNVQAFIRDMTSGFEPF